MKQCTGLNATLEKEEGKGYQYDNWLNATVTKSKLVLRHWTDSGSSKIVPVASTSILDLGLDHGQFQGDSRHNGGPEIRDCNQRISTINERILGEASMVSELYEVGLTSEYPTTVHMEHLESVVNTDSFTKDSKDPIPREDISFSGEKSLSSELHIGTVRALKLVSKGKGKGTWSRKAKTSTLAENWEIQEVKVGGKRQREDLGWPTNSGKGNASCKKAQVLQSTSLNSSLSAETVD
ncbi:unnamed protein product [Ilex paraguariensis]